MQLCLEVIDEESEGFVDLSKFRDDGVEVYYGLFVGLDE